MITEWNPPPTFEDDMSEWVRTVARTIERLKDGIDLDRHHVGTTITPKVIRSDDRKVRRFK